MSSPKKPYEPSQAEAVAELARRHLIDFAILTKPGYIPGWHHEETAEKLEAVERGEITRLMLFEPPRHGKSELGSIRFPAWYLGRNPHRSVACASYSGDLATHFGRQARNLVADLLYEEIFGKIISADSAAADRWSTVKGGHYIAVGVGGPLSGRGADVLIIDDPFKDYEEAFSPVIREKVWNWYISVALTRVHKGGAIILIMTRWHDDDLAGRILRQAKETGEHWEIVSFPAIAEKDEPNRRKGEALWPAGKPLHELMKIRDTQGSMIWQSLYQQKPPKEQGNVFKREWFRPHKGEPFGGLLRTSQIWDTAHKTKKVNDYSACVTMELRTGGVFLRNVWREKVEYPDLKRKAVEFQAVWKADEVCIEDKDAGAMLIQELQRNTRLPIIPLEADKDKVLRANAATPMCESGRVYYDADAPWVEMFFEEMMAFPGGTNDDMVDAFVHGINRLKGIGEHAVPEPERMIVDTGFRSIGTMMEEPY
jgi:predicted phage terminase large subunit-like protein